MMELLLNYPEQLCNTQLVRGWMMSELAFLHKFTVFVVCHCDFDKTSRLASVASN